MNLTNNELIFLAGTVIVVASAIVYFKSPKCTQGFMYNLGYNPNVTKFGMMRPTDTQTFPVGMEYMTAPLLPATGTNIPFQKAVIQHYPMTLSRAELEDMVAADSLSMGPGMVEGYRFRGNLNL